MTLAQIVSGWLVALLLAAGILIGVVPASMDPLVAVIAVGSTVLGSLDGTLPRGRVGR